MFVVPALSETLAGASIAKTVTALVFVVGACFGLVQSIPLLTAANTAAENIERLESRLQAMTAAQPLEVAPAKEFRRIEMRNVEFSYVDKWSEAVFKSGPIDFILRLRRSRLHHRRQRIGQIDLLQAAGRASTSPIPAKSLLDGERINDRTRHQYRELIADVFLDFHLFRKLYGIRDRDGAEIDRLLAEFRLHDKTGVTDGEFRTIDLSSGQRKRLALIVSLLEKRPILMLDEWAADQDPEFRRKFYYDLLPALNRAGVTVVAISHDDRYLDELDVPARRLQMDEGRFVGPQPVENGS